LQRSVEIIASVVEKKLAESWCTFFIEVKDQSQKGVF
jgi:hypothetical protein